MRRGKACAQFGGYLKNQRAPHLPRGFVVGLGLRFGFGLVLADLDELEKRALEQVAALRGEHDGLAGHEKGRGYLKNRFSGSLKLVWHASETENLSGYIPWVGGSVISTWLPICRIFV